MGATVLSLGWWKTSKGGGADVGAVVGGGCAEEEGTDVGAVGGGGCAEEDETVVSGGGSGGVGMVMGVVSVGDRVGLNGGGSDDGDCREEEG